MTIRTGTSFQIERHPRELSGVEPAEAYLMDAGGGLYTLGTGAKGTEATAFLVDAGSGLYTLDDDIAQEDRTLLLVSANQVM